MYPSCVWAQSHWVALTRLSVDLAPLSFFHPTCLGSPISYMRVWMLTSLSRSLHRIRKACGGWFGFMQIPKLLSRRSLYRHTAWRTPTECCIPSAYFRLEMQHSVGVQVNGSKWVGQSVTVSHSIFRTVGADVTRSRLGVWTSAMEARVLLQLFVRRPGVLKHLGQDETFFSWIQILFLLKHLGQDDDFR